MIKIDGEYLDYSEIPDIVRRVKTSDTINNGGDFSYSFDVPKTAKNIRILRVGVNRIDGISTRRIYCSIENESGHTIYTGYLTIEGVTSVISLSFFSGNTEWFTTLEGKFIYNLDLSQYRIGILQPGDASVFVPGTWDNTEGIICPLVDDGHLSDWIDPSLLNESFRPFVYVHTVMEAIFQQNGFKIEGELLLDGLYKKLVASSGDRAPAEELLVARESNIGKGGSQGLTTTFSLITFTDESSPHYDGDQGNFAGSRYTADIFLVVTVTVLYNFDATTGVIYQLRKNGVLLSTSSSVNQSGSISFTYVNLNPGDYLEVWGRTSTGTVNMTDGTINVDVIRFNAIYPQFLLNKMTQSDFVSGIFRMFNVISEYNPYSKTVTLNLFRNIRESETDLSHYVSDYSIDHVEVVSGMAKSNIFRYEEGNDPREVEYNELNGVPFGAGVLEVGGDLLSGNEEFEVPFASSFSYFNTRLMCNMSSLGYVSYEDVGDALTIVNVTSGSGGLAEFETDDPHNLSVGDVVRIEDTSTGLYVGTGLVLNIISATNFLLRGVFFDSSATGTAYKQSVTNNSEDKIFIGAVIPDMLVSDFCIDRTTITFGIGNYTNVAYFYFTKTDIGRPIDDFRDVVSFGDPPNQGFNGITLIERNYGEQVNIFENPAKIKASMNIPFKVFNSLNLTKGIRIKTPDFNVLTFVSTIESYRSSSTPCDAEFIKLG